MLLGEFFSDGCGIIFVILGVLLSSLFCMGCVFVEFFLKVIVVVVVIE